jgi:hypothetical protein
VSVALGKARALFLMRVKNKSLSFLSNFYEAGLAFTEYLNIT